MQQSVNNIVGRQEWGLGVVLPVAFRGKAPGGGTGMQSPPKDDDTFCENMLFCHGFKMHLWLYEWFQYDTEEKSTWRRKSGRASNSACPLGTKSGRPCPI